MREKALCMSRLAKFINQTAKDLGGVATAEFWPLTPGQLLAYFDANFLFDFYNRYQRLQRREIEQSALSKFFDSSDQIYKARSVLFLAFVSADNDYKGEK